MRGFFSVFLSFSSPVTSLLMLMMLLLLLSTLGSHFLFLSLELTGDRVNTAAPVSPSAGWIFTGVLQVSP